MRFRPRTLLGSFVFTSLLSFAWSSAGDRSEAYKKCTAILEREMCTPLPQQEWLSSLTRWTCLDQCKYECMHAQTDGFERERHEVLQYHGKWPFWRVLGMQEPASVAFSLLNLYAHWIGATRIRGRVPKGHPLRSYYLTSAYVSMNAWIWSAVFHIRDLPSTEKLDYFSAAATILYALYAAVVRLFHLYPAPPSPLSSSGQNGRRPLLLLWSTICVMAYMSHITYLSVLPQFDYSYNILANTIVGLLHNLLWILYAIPLTTVMYRFAGQPKGYRPYYAGKAGWLVLSTMLAMSLELFDFPAWRRVLDAHALWHLSTVPIAVFWYEFLIQDLLDQGWRTVRA